MPFHSRRRPAFRYARHHLRQCRIESLPGRGFAAGRARASRTFKRSRWLACLLVGLLLALVLTPFLFPGVKALNVAAKVLVFVVLVASFDLLLGYTGLLSFGHAAFLGAAGYLTGHSMKVWGLPPELGILAGTAFAGVLGWAFGSLAIRRAGTVLLLMRHGDQRKRQVMRPLVRS